MRKTSQFKAIALLSAAIVALAGPVSAQNQEAADALFAEENWSGAAAAYQSIVDADPENAAAWFGLARSHHALEDFAAARDAYEKAIAAGYQPLPLARYHLARALMSLKEENAALEQLEEIAKTGGPGFRTVENTAEFEPLLERPRFIAVIEALKPCTDDAYRHFDFWLGAWDVTAVGATALTAESKISAQHDGCAVLEEYSAGGGAFTGMSINFYDAAAGQWNQTWISNAGAPLYLKGGLNGDGEMVMSDAHVAKDGDSINRITWTPNDDDTVRQHWEVSSDGEKTWTTAFDGIYVARKDAD